MTPKNNWVEKMAKSIILIAIILIVLSFVGYAVIATFVLNNPEEIGSWFNRLIGGVKGDT